MRFITENVTFSHLFLFANRHSESCHARHFKRTLNGSFFFVASSPLDKGRSLYRLIFKLIIKILFSTKNSTFSTVFLFADRHSESFHARHFIKNFEWFFFFVASIWIIFGNKYFSLLLDEHDIIES